MFHTNGVSSISGYEQASIIPIFNLRQTKVLRLLGVVEVANSSHTKQLFDQQNYIHIKMKHMIEAYNLVTTT